MSVDFLEASIALPSVMLGLAMLRRGPDFDHDASAEQEEYRLSRNKV